jgi:hypothetical protein
MKRKGRRKRTMTTEPEALANLLKTLDIPYTPKKVLDKPAKLVYNIRREVGGVKEVYLEFMGKEPILHRILAACIRNRIEAVKELIDGSSLIPRPILAGGCLRDFIFDKEAKDYDFFFNCSSPEQAYEVIDELALRMGSGNYTEGGLVEDNPYEQEDADFEGVYAVFNYGKDRKTQLIVGVWPDAVPYLYDTFDLSICQVQMDIDTYDITISENFVRSLIEKRTINYKPESSYSKHRKIRFDLDLFGIIDNKDNYDQPILPLPLL